MMNEPCLVLSDETRPVCSAKEDEGLLGQDGPVDRMDDGLVDG